MPIDNLESNAVLSKSLALIQKTKLRVDRIDSSLFPTSSSKEAKTLLERALESLRNPVLLGPMDPRVLYNRLISLQGLVEDLEASTSAHISWPLVSYCDDTWTSLFGTQGPRVFYSVTREYNYSIVSYTALLKFKLAPLLPVAKVNEILRGPSIYRLHLASLEDDNLPLYANIAHEFGHVLFETREQELLSTIQSELGSSLKVVFDSLNSEDASQAGRRMKRAKAVLLRLVEEVFADVMGALLAGPAFFLSLYEMAWGDTRSTWGVELSPHDIAIQAHPSFNFRLSIIRKFARLDGFAKEANGIFGSLETPDLRNIVASVAQIPSDHPDDVIQVLPDADKDGKAIRDAMTAGLDILKKSLELLADYFNGVVLKCLGPHPPQLATSDVFQLLRRLEHHILPNIVPDGTLRGRPTDFPTTLNASALFRMHVLLKRSAGMDTAEMLKEVRKIERLTAKALEVSYVQRRFMKPKA